uniref:Leucine rich immune protein (Short) n=1 Tax=Anopheles atroparvus TaxID=41427 RepID=A0A182JAX3_ANOAO
MSVQLVTVAVLLLAILPPAFPYSCVTPVKDYCVVENVTQPYTGAKFPPNERAVWIRNSTLPTVDRELFEALGAVENLMIHRLQIERLVLVGCDSLDVLFAANNAISSVEATEGLPLRQLHLYQNRLTDVSGLRVLSAIEQLYLHDNLLETLRLDVFAPLDRLKILTLQRNRLRSITTHPSVPTRTLSLPRLEQLFLQFNQLPVLDTSLWRMERLRVLDLSHNQLGYLLTFLEELPSLRTVELHHNPWNCGWLFGMLERLAEREMDSFTTEDEATCTGILLEEQVCCSENATAPDPVLLLVSRTGIVDELQHQVRGARKQIDALEEAQRKHTHQLREFAKKFEQLEQLCSRTSAQGKADKETNDG